MLGSVGIAGTTAAIVFASGVYVVERDWPARSRAADAPPTDLTSAPWASAGSAMGMAGPGALDQEATDAESAPAGSAGIPRVAAPAAPSPPSEVSEAASLPARTSAPMRKGYGTLKLISSQNATVYVTGVAVGATNRPHEVRCGRSFVRIGEPTPHGTQWLGKGRTVAITCGALTEVGF
jgi:hypothetical protein